MKCPACNIEMEPLVSGIFQCPSCKKILKVEDKSSKIKEQKEVQEGDFQDSDTFPRLNPQFEIVDKGI
ncbi:MAG: hypothetical protein ACFFAO_01680, partial [Candidatus Hermodarchaeota archaeon]